MVEEKVFSFVEHIYLSAMVNIFLASLNRRLRPVLHVKIIEGFSIRYLWISEAFHFGVDIWVIQRAIL